MRIAVDPYDSANPIQFFLDIWEGLQDRARQANSIGSMSVADVAERTSKSVEGDSDGGSLFDETANWYARLRERSEKIIIDTLNNNVRDALRPYRLMYVAHAKVTALNYAYLWQQQPMGDTGRPIRHQPFANC